MKRLDKLQEILKGLKFNIDKFCDYGLKTLTTLTDAGGDNSQAFEKFYKALKLTPSSEFSNFLVVWRSVLDHTSTDLVIGELLSKTRSDYMGMVALKTSSTCGSTNEKTIPKKSKEDSDITTLLTSSEAANARSKPMTKALVKASKKGYPAIVGNCD